MEFARTENAIPELCRFVYRTMFDSKCYDDVFNCACVLLKNLIQKHWAEISPNEPRKDDARSLLLEILFKMPRKVPASLMECIRLVSESDYPKYWPSFLESLRASAESLDQSYPKNVTVLFSILDHCFEYLRRSSKTDLVIMEVIDITKMFGPQIVSNLTESKSFLNDDTSSDRLRMVIHTLSLYRSIISFDIPQYFVDHSSELFQYFHYALCDLGTSQLLDEPRDSIINSIMEILTLYANMFEDDIEILPTLAELSLSIIVVQSGRSSKSLISTLRFISAIINKDSIRASFENSLELIVDKIIVPNLRNNEDDLELLDESPIEFVRSMINFSPEDNLKDAVMSLIHSLIDVFPEKASVCMSNNVKSIINSRSEQKQLAQAIKLFTSSYVLDYKPEVSRFFNFRLVYVVQTHFTMEGRF